MQRQLLNLRRSLDAVPIIRHFIASLFACFCTVSLASDIGNEVIRSDMQQDSPNGGYFELGLGLASWDSAIYGYPEENTHAGAPAESGAYLSVNANYTYNGFFIEVYTESIQGVALGYNVGQTQYWSFDLVATGAYEYFGKETSDAWRDLKERKESIGLGIRATYYSPHFIAQFHALTDASDSYNGHTGSVYLGKNFQWQNWNLYTLAGANYHSDAAVDYYVGIDEDEATPELPYHEGKAGLEKVIELGAAYPLSQKWVFRTSYRYTSLPNSPLIVKEADQIFTTSVSYVF